MAARVIDRNTASERVLTKLGFRHEGALLRRGNFEDVRMYSALRDEWVLTGGAPAVASNQPKD